MSDAAAPANTTSVAANGIDAGNHDDAATATSTSDATASLASLTVTAVGTTIPSTSSSSSTTSSSLTSASPSSSSLATSSNSSSSTSSSSSDNNKVVTATTSPSSSSPNVNDAAAVDIAGDAADKLASATDTSAAANATTATTNTTVVLDPNFVEADIALNAAGYYDDVEIEDMDYEEDTRTFYYPCPCGDRFQITWEQLRDGDDVAICPSCSLQIRIVYNASDFDESEDELEPEL